MPALRIYLITIFYLVFSQQILFAADFLGDTLKKNLPMLPGLSNSPTSDIRGNTLDNSTIASGLKEALSIGTNNAVRMLSKPSGYYGNQAIKILLPDKLQKAAELLGKLGYQKQVDEFIQSMNSAAEKAAPKAAPYFVDAIKEMSIDDARKILAGSNTSATEYFRSKTSSKLYDEFKPSISETMNQVGVMRSYNSMISKIPVLPFLKPESVDLDHYITTKALDGLFYMVGREETKIRTNPIARTTDLLKNVFGK